MAVISTGDWWGRRGGGGDWKQPPVVWRSKDG